MVRRVCEAGLLALLLTGCSGPRFTDGPKYQAEPFQVSAEQEAAVKQRVAEYLTTGEMPEFSPMKAGRFASGNGIVCGYVRVGWNPHWTPYVVSVSQSGAMFLNARGPAAERYCYQRGVVLSASGGGPE